MMRICNNICRMAPNLRTVTDGTSKRNVAGISIKNVLATPSRHRSGWSWCTCHASGPGKHCVAKWNSNAVKLFQVGQFACILTTPDMSMSLNNRNLIGHEPTWTSCTSSLLLYIFSLDCRLGSVMVLHGQKQTPVRKPASHSNISHWNVYIEAPSTTRNLYTCVTNSIIMPCCTVPLVNDIQDTKL